MQPHPSDVTLLRLADGELTDPREHADVAAHVDACAACTSSVRYAGALRAALARTVPRPEFEPAPQLSEHVLQGLRAGLRSRDERERTPENVRITAPDALLDDSLPADAHTLADEELLRNFQRLLTSLSGAEGHSAGAAEAGRRDERSAAWRDIARRMRDERTPRDMGHGGEPFKPLRGLSWPSPGRAAKVREMLEAALTRAETPDLTMVRLHLGLDGGPQLGIEQIAELLGTPPDEVRRALQTALERIRDSAQAALERLGASTRL